MSLNVRGAFINASVKTLQMILDGKLEGTLDAGAGCLEVFEKAAADTVYPAALAALANMGAAIDTLSARSLRGHGLNFMSILPLLLL